MTLSVRRAALACAYTGLAGLTAVPAMADPVPAEQYVVSPGGVDMRTGQYTYKNTDLAIGGEAGLALVRDNGIDDFALRKPFGNTFSHNWHIFILERPNSSYSPDTGLGQGSGYMIAITAGGRSTSFTAENLSNNLQLAASTSYAQLTSTGTGAQRQYIYTAADGTVINFRPIGNLDCPSYGIGWGIGRCALASQIVQPDGHRFDLQYDAAPSGGGARLRRVTSNRGYALIFEYSSSVGNKLVSKACAINLALQTAPTDNICPGGALSASYSYQSLNSYISYLTSYTDPTNLTYGFDYGYNATAQATQQRFFNPGETTPYLINEVGDSTTFKQIFADGRIYNYNWNSITHNEYWIEVAGGSYSLNGGPLVSVVFDQIWTYGLQSFRITPGPVAITDELGRTTEGSYCIDLNLGCAVMPVLGWELPEGNVVGFEYDLYLNVKKTTLIAKPGSNPALDPIVTSATFNCVSALLCAKPTTRTDARQNVTEYEWDPVHGGLLKETGPAVPTRQANGSMADVRPQKRNTYVQRYAWLSNGGGGYTQAASPVWLLSTESFCRTSAASGAGCAIAGDEVVTTYDYGPDSGPNNLLLRGIVVTADGQSLRTCFGYDALGRKVSETAPAANLAACS